jgi:hypothetical protein
MGVPAEPADPRSVGADQLIESARSAAQRVSAAMAGLDGTHIAQPCECRQNPAILEQLAQTN